MKYKSHLKKYTHPPTKGMGVSLWNNPTLNNQFLVGYQGMCCIDTHCCKDMC